jgi:hypothetical protein
MNKFINKDSHINGAVIGLFLPIIAAAISYGIALIIDTLANMYLSDNLASFMLIGIAFNLWPIRYYFVTKKLELTGRGMLLVTFIYIVVFFGLK